MAELTILEGFDELTLVEEGVDLVIEADVGLPGRDGANGAGGFSQKLDQLSAASTWIFVHGKGAIPNVQVYLTSGERIIADVMSSSTSVTIVFATPTSGFIILT
jgi:hypothetical protein